MRRLSRREIHRREMGRKEADEEGGGGEEDEEEGVLAVGLLVRWHAVKGIAPPLRPPTHLSARH